MATKRVKQQTQTFIRKKDCKHSVVFEPIGNNDPNKVDICSSVYVNRLAMPDQTVQQIKLQVLFPDGSNDQEWQAVPIA
jgi:hypothetical protein